MDQIIFTKNYPPPPLSRREILRYMRCEDAADNVSGLIDESLSEMLPLLVYKVCWRTFPVKEIESGLDLGFMQTESRDLMHNLQACERFILFAATIGLATDRLITKYGRLSPAKALCMQAIGAERIESVCDEFCDEQRQKYEAEGLAMKPRFSPGYGDFPLEAQRDVFRALDCHRKIGLSLNDSLLMSPSKSVSAIVGLSQKETIAKAREKAMPADKNDFHLPPAGCKACSKTDCEFRQA